MSVPSMIESGHSGVNCLGVGFSKKSNFQVKIIQSWCTYSILVLCCPLVAPA